jgi:Fic family protein
LELDGYIAASRWLAARSALLPRAQTGTAISVAEIRRIHALAVAPAWARYPPKALHPDAGPGRFRRTDVRPWSNVRPPPWPLVGEFIARWVTNANRLGSPAAVSDAMSRFAALHCEFERIHPFRDGNGRAGRLVLNLLLLRYGLPTVTICAHTRDDYYRALTIADDGDPVPLGDVLVAAFDHAETELSPAGPSRRPLL